MCPYCQHVLSGIVVPHTIYDCNYRRSMYCFVCAAYGHTMADCPNKEAQAIRKGQVPKEKNLVLSVKSTDQGIKEVLESHHITPGTTKMENRKRLRDLANSLNPPRLIVFVK